LKNRQIQDTIFLPKIHETSPK